jgi:phenylacetate-coenzyme A ligase PaaK-like adenylate-forming protein
MTALERIEGRSDDLFYFPSQGPEHRDAEHSDAECRDAGRLVPVFPDFIRRAIMEAAPEALEYRVCQLAEGLVEVSLRLPAEAGDVEERVATRMARLADELGAVPPMVTFTPYEAHRSDRKLRRVERRF